MKKILALILILTLSMVVFIGCETTVAEKSSDQIQAEKAERAMKQAVLAVSEPAIHNWYEKNQVKDIYEKRDNPDLICHAYTKNIEGDFIYLGMSKGFGVNASIQFTNPIKVQGAEDDYGIRSYEGDQAVLVPQAEPNGLMMPEGLAATYINLLNEETGEFYLAYIEDNLNVFENKLPRRLCDEESLPADY